MESSIEVLGEKCKVEDKLIYFPSDNKLREQYFAPGDKGHPARANLYMMVWLIERLTKPGDTILDPTSGAGSLLWATTVGRNVVCVELEEHLADIQVLSWEYLKMHHKVSGTYTLLRGDARRHLPIVGVNHTIFSPPYSVNIEQAGKKVAALAMESGAQSMGYGNNPAQLSKLGYFNLKQSMREIYRGLYQSLPIGGYMCTITKDSVDSKAGVARGLGGLMPYSADNLRLCYEVGFELAELWQRHAPPSLRLQIAWSQNPNIPKVVTEELIICQKRR